MSTAADIREDVRGFYGLVGSGEATGCAPGCCAPSGEPSAVMGYDEAELAALPDGADLSLGCGNPVALAGLKSGEVVVDLGSGGGIDAFLAAERVGATGRVIGVDMTPSMIERARRNAAQHGTNNVEFRLGEIESLPVADDAVDAIISNCVVNLSPDKGRVYREALRVLKPGGRIEISDIVALGPIPDSVRADAAAIVGCVGNAATPDEHRAWLVEAGFDRVDIALQAHSKELIDQWMPGRGLEKLVASARITAFAPTSAAGCCAPSCCDD